MGSRAALYQEHTQPLQFALQKLLLNGLSINLSVIMIK